MKRLANRIDIISCEESVNLYIKIRFLLVKSNGSAKTWRKGCSCCILFGNFFIVIFSKKNDSIERSLIIKSIIILIVLSKSCERHLNCWKVWENFKTI